MNALEKMKLTNALKNAVGKRDAESNPLKKLSLAKEVQELRKQLGLVGDVRLSENAKEDVQEQKQQSETEIQPLQIPENATPSEREALASQWLKDNVQGKAVIAVDGKKIYFNRNLSVDHLANNARKDKSGIIAQCIPFIADVFKTGKFIERQPLTKPRTDGKTAFHLYEKWVQIDNVKVLLEAKACEYGDGRYEALGEAIAYNVKAAHLPSNLSLITDNALGGIEPLYEVNNTLLLGNLQPESDCILRIKAITDLNGNPISLDDETENADDLSKSLDLPDNPTKSDLSKAVNDWLRKNVQGKTIIAVDGKKVFFNRSDSVEHLSYDGRRSELAAKAIPYIVEVFQNGNFDRKEELNKERKDHFVAFHCYRKTVQIDDKKVLLEAKSGEKENGEFEALSPLIAYHQKIISLDSVKEKGHFLPYIKSMDLNGELAPIGGNDNAILDSVQPENALLTILAVTDLDGNPINLDDDPVQSSLNKADLFNYNPESGSTATKRQRANNKAMAIVKEIWAGKISLDNLTDEQKIILSEYSGSGGGLTDHKGDKGSQYEYYTPKEIATGMWDLLKESGFSGGKVLDPCAGTGIFSAAAPDNILMENVELDRVSGTINQAIFNGSSHKTTIAPFEEVAASTADEQFDAVITNVPFGDNADRGGNQFKDNQYQDEALDSYFILRSLKKLKPNGLAVFMCSTRIMSGVHFRRQRIAMSEMAEFIGAYRLPNKVFNSANADVITDVLVFKKHSAETKERISEVLLEDTKGRELLEQANVLWQPFIEGRYFKEHPQYVLGSETQVKGKYGLQEAIESDASMADIAKMMRKFGGSRIDWALLRSQEGELITYQNGDTTYFDGVLRAYENGKWLEVETAQTKETLTELIQQKLQRFSSPLQIIEEKLPLEELLEAIKTVQERQISLQYLPDWLRELLRMAK